MEVLLERSLRLTPADDRTNILLPFTVPHDFARLEFHCAYTPKHLTDPDEVWQAVAACYARYLRPQDRPAEIDPAQFTLNNLVTLSVDCGARYLGAAHRQAPDQVHTISRDFASPGFWKWPAKAGQWRAVINVHALASREVQYTLRVVGKEADEA